MTNVIPVDLLLPRLDGFSVRSLQLWSGDVSRGCGQAAGDKRGYEVSVIKIQYRLMFTGLVYISRALDDLLTPSTVTKQTVVNVLGVSS